MGETRTTTALLRCRADQIDRRLGPIPGRDADAIATELRASAETIDTLLALLRRARHDMGLGGNSLLTDEIDSFLDAAEGRSDA